MNTVKTTMFLSCLTDLLLVFGRMLGGQSGMAIALIMVGIMNFSAYWFSDKIVLMSQK